MNSEIRSEPILSQEHSGPGDNIGRDKIINEYRKLAPESLRKTIDLILSDCRERKTDTAKIRLETIKSTDSLDSDSETILNMASVRLNLLNKAEKIKVHGSLNLFLNNSTDPLTCDLCLATLIRLDIENKRVEDARERYQNINQPSIYSQESFYELIANSKELEEIYENKRIELGESELNGLIRGSFRTDNLELALTVANRLNDVCPSLNSKVLLLMAKASILININLRGKNFWTITSNLKEEVMAVIEEVSSLIEETAGMDSRLFNIAAPCLQYTLGCDKKLNELCWKYIDEIEKIHPEIAAELHNINAKDTSKLEDPHLLRHAKAHHDVEYRSQLLSKIFSSKEISTADFVILKDFSNKNKIKQWERSGGIVSGQENLETDFSNIQLSLISLPSKTNRTKVEEIRVKTERFITNYQDKLAKFNPILLLELAESLLKYPELSSNVCDLIKPMLPASNYWLSPIVKCYIEALLASQQMATLTTILSGTNEHDWDSFIWLIQASIHEQEGDYTKAIESVEKALNFDSCSLYSWSFLVRLYFKFRVSGEDILSVLNKVPDSVLLKKSDLATPLLFEIARAGDFPRAERVILSWFIDDPDACAVTMSNFHFNLSMIGQEIDPCAKNISNGVIGVRFKKDNQIFLKLLIDNETIKHHYLLDINSPLGEILLKMDLKEVKALGMHQIELLERLPPYVAAFQISLELRQVQNDGSDCFYAFNFPEKPDEMGHFLQRLLDTENENKNNIIENPDVPIIFKGFFLHPNDPVKAALEQLSTIKPNTSLLPNFGEDSISEVILDVYAIIYLALTGLAFGVKDSPIKFVITEETKYVIEQWLQEINDGNHSSLGCRSDGELWLQSAEDIKQSTQFIRDELHYVISKAEVVTPLLVDMPPELLQFQDIIDYSVYSSIKLSISNDIPWLSMDGMFAHLFISSGWRVVNVVTLFNTLGSNLSFQQKKDGLYQYALGAIPYALTFQDLRLLRDADDEHAHYFLAKIILLHPKAFTDTKTAVEFWSSILISVLAKAYLDGEILKGLRIHNARNNGYAERVFNACSYAVMQCNDGTKSELAFSMLIYSLVDQFRAVPMMVKLISLLATQFATGHFLCISAINKHIAELS